MTNATQWEYFTLKVPTKGFLGGKFDQKALDMKMNALGRQGWELASSMVTTNYYMISSNLVFSFKRPVHY